MPATVTMSSLPKLNRLLDKLESSELIEKLGADLAQRLADNSPVASGATARAWRHLGTPQRIPGGWSIGVGSGDAFGSKDEPAPRGTLRAFYDYLDNAGIDFNGYTDWWGLSRENKSLLEQGRRAGKFGGRGQDYANYMWVQNYGNAKAKVTGTHFIEKSIQQWRSEVPDIVRSYFTE